MEVFRISKKAFSAIDGIGGLYYPGRWHNAGYRVVYTAQYRSLAALETLVHLSKTHLILDDFVISSILVPDNAAQKILDHTLLPKTWNSMRQLSVTRQLGSEFLSKLDSLILKVPSAIVEKEFNFILNPLHTDFYKCKIIEQHPFRFDNRLYM